MSVPTVSLTGVHPDEVRSGSETKRRKYTGDEAPRYHKNVGSDKGSGAAAQPKPCFKFHIGWSQIS